MKRARTILCVASLVLFLLAGSAPALAAGPPPAALEPVTIAIMAPLTGPVPDFGQLERDGALLAIEQQNARGGLLGHTVQYQIWDTQCSGTVAATAAQEAIATDKLRYVLGEVCSGASLPISVVANQNGALQVTPASTDPRVTQYDDGTVKPYTYRACFTNPFQARAAARFAYTTLAARKAFIMYNPDDSYSKGLADAFAPEATGRGMTVESATYASGTTDFSAVLNAAAAAHPDVIYLPDYYNVANLVTAQAPANGIGVPFIGGDAWDSTSLNTSTTDGDYFTNHDFTPEDPRPEVQAFVSAFKARFNYEPGVIAALAYDAANLMFKSVEAANTLDTSVVSRRMAGIVFYGVTGKVIFDPLHNPIKTVAVFKVHDGGRHFFSSVDLIVPVAYLPVMIR